MSEALFLDTIEKHYRKLLLTDPLYAFAAENTEKSVALVRKNALKNHIAFEGPACRATCAELGILPMPLVIALYIQGIYVPNPKFRVGQRVSGVSRKARHVFTVQEALLNRNKHTWYYNVFTDEGRDLTFEELKLVAEEPYDASDVSSWSACEVQGGRRRARGRGYSQREKNTEEQMAL